MSAPQVTSAPKYMLETRGVTKRFGALVAVDNVDFQLPVRELRAIIGPNGAGKSTFFSMLMGGQRPTSGQIQVRDTNVSSMRPEQISRLGMSLAFQVTNIFPNLAVEDNLRLSAQSRAMNFNPLKSAAAHPETEQRLDEILREIGLADKRSFAAASLSHGEQKYLEIGIALANQPQILLLDEPTAGMSIEETRATADLIKRLSERLSVIFVEHDMEVVMQVADTITVFHQGRILAEGSPEIIRDNSDVQQVYLRGA